MKRKQRRSGIADRVVLGHRDPRIGDEPRAVVHAKFHELHAGGVVFQA